MLPGCSCFDERAAVTVTVSVMVLGVALAYALPCAFPWLLLLSRRAAVEVTVPVLVQQALAHLERAALVYALPSSLAAPVLGRARSRGGDSASAKSTGTPSGSGVGIRTPVLPGCSCFDERAAVEVTMLVLRQRALVHRVGAAYADALPCPLAAPALASVQLRR